MAAQIMAAIAHRITIDGQGDGAPGPSDSCRRPALPTTICATTSAPSGCGVGQLVLFRHHNFSGDD